jgi:bacterioferritin-associated ferredoxin
MSVDRCICHKISFSEIKKIAEKNGYSTIEELQKANISSTNCKLCQPYVKEMLRSGKTSFSVK